MFGENTFKLRLYWLTYKSIDMDSPVKLLGFLIYYGTKKSIQERLKVLCSKFTRYLVVNHAIIRSGFYLSFSTNTSPTKCLNWTLKGLRIKPVEEYI